MGSEFSTEEIKIRGEELLAKVKELVREGNVRRLIIKDGEGATLIEVPLTVGVIGAVLLPVWAAIGAIAALATDCTIVVERRGESAPASGEESASDTGPTGDQGPAY
jgi:Flp pilus assembly pilin Flp